MSEEAKTVKEVTKAVVKAEEFINSAESIQDQKSIDIATTKKIYSESIKSAVNVAPENNKELLPVLERVKQANKCVLMSFIAPSISKKISPYESIPASIRTYEELAIEKAICDIKSSLEDKGIAIKPNLLLLVNSPGGYVSSSSVIANMIRDNFDHIKIFVPHTAVSGGTLLSFAGNEIVMGEMSRLSPIDTQTGYQGVRVSAQSFRRAIERFDEYFKDKNPFEVPYTWKSMAEKFDPIIREEWDVLLKEIWTYGDSLLTKSGYTDEARSWILFNLVLTPYPHGFIVNRNRARELGLIVKDDTSYPLEWSAMKAWFSLYFLKAESQHFIRYLV